jgi:hypothetical protein
MLVFLLSFSSYSVTNPQHNITIVLHVYRTGARACGVRVYSNEPCTRAQSIGLQYDRVSFHMDEVCA